MKARGFASAEATKGLCDRPLETFAASFPFKIMVNNLAGVSRCGATKGLSGRPLETFGASAPYRQAITRLFINQ